MWALPMTAMQTAACVWMSSGRSGGRRSPSCTSAAKYMQERGKLEPQHGRDHGHVQPGPVQGLWTEEGIGYAKTAVGDKYVYENMAQTGNCGWAASSPAILSSPSTPSTGDGILTTLKIMEAMLAKQGDSVQTGGRG